MAKMNKQELQQAIDAKIAEYDKQFDKAKENYLNKHPEWTEQEKEENAAKMEEIRAKDHETIAKKITEENTDDDDDMLDANDREREQDDDEKDHKDEDDYEIE